MTDCSTELTISTVSKHHSVHMSLTRAETWDGDAFLRISGQKASMYSEEGKLWVPQP